MEFDTENKVVRLCAEGMTAEGKGETVKAGELFTDAWNNASTDFEKFTEAHYVARHQPSIEKKLHWDQTALAFALRISDESMKAYLPSLYLNIAKVHEDMHDFHEAKAFYETAHTYTSFLPQDGYGKMILAGIANGLQRAQEKIASKE